MLKFKHSQNTTKVEGCESNGNAEIYAILKHLPLYRRKNREEVFLGIRKSKHKNWIGWDYIARIRKESNFDKLLIELGLYELAVHFWEFQVANGNEISFDYLVKQYDF